MGTIIGSARHDENGNLTKGKVGDQLQKSSTLDLIGEVSLQNFYVHSKGWYILRPKDKQLADDLASAMNIAVHNKCIGYSQSASRTKPINIKSAMPINTDCSMLIRGCIYYACGKDVGNFTTANEASKLVASGLFNKIAFVSEAKTPVHNGDVLVTKTKGHTVIVVSGNPRPQEKTYYPKYIGNSTSIVMALNNVGVKDTSLVNRKKIASANGIKNYTGTASQNTQMLKLLKNGKLIKV